MTRFDSVRIVVEHAAIARTRPVASTRAKDILTAVLMTLAALVWGITLTLWVSG